MNGDSINAHASDGETLGLAAIWQADELVVITNEIASFCRETHKPFACLGLHAIVASGLQVDALCAGFEVCCA
jgi:hypothetical protein